MNNYLMSFIGYTNCHEKIPDVLYHTHAYCWTNDGHDSEVISYYIYIYIYTRLINLQINPDLIEIHLKILITKSDLILIRVILMFFR